MRRLGGPGDGYDPGLLGHQPCQRHLRGGESPCVAVMRQRVDQAPVCDDRVGLVSRQRMPVVVRGVVARAFVDGSGEIRPAEWTVRDEADAELLADGDDVLFRIPRHQRVFALKRGDRLHAVRPADVLRPGLAETEVPHLPLPDEVRDSACHVLDRNLRIDAVLIEQVDDVRLQSLQRSLHHLSDVLRPAVEGARHPVVANVHAELAAQHDPLPEGPDGFAHELFVDEGSVDLRGVEEGHAHVEGLPDQPDGALPIGDEAPVVAHAHASQSE